MTPHLMRSRRFAPLFWTQFLSAFNDNFLKNTLVFLILFKLAASEAAALVSLAGAVFILPFLVLSATGGELADKFDKALVARRLKFIEIFAAALAVGGIALSSIPLIMTALFAVGVVSALFGPVKYGILPDHLDKRDLPKANAWIEAATFGAILAGTIVGGIASTGGASVVVFGPMMMGLAFACWFASRFIPSTGAAAPDLVIDRNVFRATWRLVADLHTDFRIWRAALMVSWFWMGGAIILSVMPPLVKTALGGGEIAVTAYLAVFAVAVAVGSSLAAWMAQGRIVLLLAPIGTILMAVFGLDLAVATWSLSAAGQTDSLGVFFAKPGTIRTAIDLAGMAIAGAFLVVPTFAAVQAWASPERRARVVGAVNAVNAGFMTVGGLVVAAVQSVGVTTPVVIAGLSVANLVAGALMLRYLPTNPFRDFLSILFRAFHRLEVEGLDNLRAAGPAPILALNHVSFLDGALALTLSDQEPVFAIDYSIAQAWWVKPFLKMTRALPLNPAKPMSTRALIKVVKGGDPMVIFPEGRITVTGSLMKVYDGAAMVADKTGAMIVPIKIDGLERSPFSRMTSAQVRRSLFPKVRVTILPPVRLALPEGLAGRQRRAAAGTALYEIMSDLVFVTQDVDRTVLEKIIDVGSRRGMARLAVQDPVVGSLSYGKLLTGAAVLAGDFRKRLAGEDTVGLMLPNANATCASLLGLMSAGKVAAMINFTGGARNVISACEAAQVKTIVSSRAFVKQAKLEQLVAEVGRTARFVWLEDIRETIGPVAKIKGILGRGKPLVERQNRDPAVILFTSGSEGTPKGVVLTHRNILANVAQAASRIDFGSADKLFNVLPMFHSFGLTAGTILPLASGVPVYLYPSPLHYRIVPELVYAANATIIFGTDTFLAGYARTAHPYDFRSLRYCFAGAEPVKQSTRETYMNRFGIRILEGYGVTETAPVLAINTPMYNRPGTVGKLLPAVEWRLDPVPGIEEGGRLFVRGPNVMAGYLRAERPGVIDPPVDGWHDTGDIVTVDAEGFIAIRGRAKRFAKIGGEMISLAAVDALASSLWPQSLSAAAAVADPKKGQRIVLFTTAPDASRAALQAHARAEGAADLMVPAEIRVLAQIPLLGTGKIDYRAVDTLATAPENGSVQAA